MAFWEIFHSGTHQQGIDNDELYELNIGILLDRLPNDAWIYMPTSKKWSPKPFNTYTDSGPDIYRAIVLLMDL